MITSKAQVIGIAGLAIGLLLFLVACDGPSPTSRPRPGGSPRRDAVYYQHSHTNHLPHLSASDPCAVGRVTYPNLYAGTANRYADPANGYLYGYAHPANGYLYGYASSPHDHADGNCSPPNAAPYVPASSAHEHADSHTASPDSDVYPDLDADAADGHLYRYASAPHGHTDGGGCRANSHLYSYANTPYVHTDDCANPPSRHTYPDLYPTSHLTAQWLVCRWHTIWAARLPKS